MKLIRYQNLPNATVSAFDHLFGSRSAPIWGSQCASGGLSSLATPVDLFEDESNFYARLELPGRSKGDIELELEDSVLTLSLKLEPEEGEEEGKSRILRALSVPDGVDQASVSATLEHGVLTVTLPKTEASKPRQIEIS